MRFVSWMHNNECMKGLERHKTDMFNEYVRKYFENARDRKSTRLNSSHSRRSRMPSSA